MLNPLLLNKDHMKHPEGFPPLLPENITCSDPDGRKFIWLSGWFSAGLRKGQTQNDQDMSYVPSSLKPSQNGLRASWLAIGRCLKLLCISNQESSLHTRHSRSPKPTAINQREDFFIQVKREQVMMWTGCTLRRCWNHISLNPSIRFYFQQSCDSTVLQNNHVGGSTDKVLLDEIPLKSDTPKLSGACVCVCVCVCVWLFPQVDLF